MPQTTPFHLKAMMILVIFFSAYRRRIAEKGSTEPEQKEDKTVS